MPATDIDPGSDSLLDLRDILTIRQIPGVLLSREADHYAQPVAMGAVEQFSRRRRMRDANGVEAGRRHLPKVAFDDLQVLIFPLCCVGSKRAVGDTTNPELLRAGVEKLSARNWPLEDRRSRNGVHGSSRRLPLRMFGSARFPSWQAYSNSW